MKGLRVYSKLVADQLGQTLDLHQNVYTRSPVESRMVVVNQLEEAVVDTVAFVQRSG
jgi:hypothetical protein